MTAAMAVNKNTEDVQELRFVAIFFFLFAYLFGFLENISIITSVFRESHLHSPMYFFLKNLSFLDMCYISVTIPKALFTSLTGSGLISYLECVAQLYVFITLASTECFLLMAMAYDRCLAILKPLLYRTNVNDRLSSELVAMAWVSRPSTLTSTPSTPSPCPSADPTSWNTSVTSPIIRLTCTDYCLNEEVGFAVSRCIIMSAFALTVLSYVGITSAIMQIPTGEGWWKAFSTCSSHLTTVILFYRTGSFMYLRPASQYSPTQGCLASIFYSILTPTLNPAIYCLRNKDMKFALQKLYCPPQH
ncbi:Olfactory receptor 2G3 [Heterocephalus glaber]|uniref:Olfactory receptor n=1 Tax=Heterocephalus glaber TaxID=10181 RepID=G5BRH8_HETGA|nr:Olfactory receptor 2G3 [Heterocephalus glaber]